MRRQLATTLGTGLAIMLGLPLLASSPAAAATPRLSISTAFVAEGDTGNRTVTVTATLSEPSAATVTANFSTVGAGATPGVDFTAKSGTLTFLAGQVRKHIGFTVRPDVAVEADELLTIQLSSIVGATLGSNGAVVISNDESDPAFDGVNLSDVDIAEGDITNRDTYVMITLGAPLANNVTGMLSLTGISATAGNDFVALTNKPFTIKAGARFTKVKVTLIPDLTDELLRERIYLEIHNVVGAGIGVETGSIFIVDDDV